MKRIAIVLSSVGYHWEEVFDAVDVFTKAAYELRFFTVLGQPPVPDPYSVKLTGPGAWFGLGTPRSIAPTSPEGRALVERMHGAESIQHLHPSDTDAIYLPGGHGCLFDINRNPDLHFIIGKLFDWGKLLCAVCHATSTFAFVERNGKSIVEGHAITGFPKAFDRVLLRLGGVHPRFTPLPFHNEDVLRQSGVQLTRYDVFKAALLPTHTEVSLPFITGVGPKAAWRVAAHAVKALSNPAPVRVESSADLGSGEMNPT